MNSLGGSSGYASAGGLTPKQQMLADLKAKAEARKEQEGAESPSQTIQDIESVTKPVTVKVTNASKTPSLKTAATAGRFLSRLQGKHQQPAPQVQTVSVRPFATIADPDVLVEANAAPSTDVYQLEMSMPAHLKENYNFFKSLCEKNNIPAGLMSLLWIHLLNDITIINFDTSYSMKKKDGYSPADPKTKLEKNFNIEVTDFGENREGMAIHPRQTRINEARSRLKEVMPILCAANRQGRIHLKSFADPVGVTLDPRTMTYDRMVGEANRFLDNVQAVTNHTPSVSSYLASCREATAALRNREVASATIIEATDGEPNEGFKPKFENIYRNYEQTVLRQRQDYTREDGTRISNSEARIWNMDQKTPPLMRRLSVLAGHFAIPTTFAACTDNDDEIGELNEIDMLHTTFATLDDIKGEQQEVLRAQGPRFPFNLATYMALYFIAPKEGFLDQLDEKPLDPEQLEKYLGYYPGHDAYVSNLEHTQAAVLASAEQAGYQVPVAVPVVTPSAPPANFDTNPYAAPPAYMPPYGANYS